MNERMIEGSGGVRLHVVEDGDPASERKVVLLHGFPEFWYSWRHQIPALANAGFHVIAPDMRGYNDSDKPSGIEAYRLVHLVEDIRALIDPLNVEAVYLVGHDWGGVVAWTFAIQHPEQILRLAVLNTPHPTAIRRARRNWEQLARFSYQFFLNLPALPELVLRTSDFAALRTIMRRALKRAGAFTDADRDRYIASWSRPNAMTSALNYYRALIQKGTGLNHPHTPLQIPTLLIWGESEPVFLRNLAEDSRKYVRTMKLACIENAGHYVHQDQPEQVNELLLSWFG